MFTLMIQDEQVYQRLMARVEKAGSSLDVVLRQWLDITTEEDDVKFINGISVDTPYETRGQRLMRLVDEADLVFTNPINADDVKKFLREEMGQITWRDPK